MPSSAPPSPLSTFSRTPSPPSSPVRPRRTLLPVTPHRLSNKSRAGMARKCYLSPSSTASPSSTQSPLNNSIHLPSSQFDDEAPSAKRRRISAPKPRTTEYLDMLNPLQSRSATDNVLLDRLMSAIRRKKKIVVVAGAGISVSAGIPDFRSSSGLFSTLRSQHKLKASGRHLFDASVYQHDESTDSFHQMVRELARLTERASPTPFHHLLASLAVEGRLMRLYSQNVDCIETSMSPLKTTVPLNKKGPWPLTIQLHGGLEKMVCTKCADLRPFDPPLFHGPEPPLCDSCRVNDAVRTEHAGKRSHGIGRLRPRILLYNEYNPDEDAIGTVSSADLRRRPDAVLVVGTSLKVPGVRRLVRELCLLTRSRRDGFTAWINVDPEPVGADLRDCWDLVVRATSDDVAGLANLPLWDDPDHDSDNLAFLTEEDDRLRHTRLARDALEVHLLSSSSPSLFDPASPFSAGTASTSATSVTTATTPVASTPASIASAQNTPAILTPTALQSKLSCLVSSALNAGKLDSRKNKNSRLRRAPRQPLATAAKNSSLSQVSISTVFKTVKKTVARARADARSQKEKVS